jgi:hypothetical protein
MWTDLLVWSGQVSLIVFASQRASARVDLANVFDG